MHHGSSVWQQVLRQWLGINQLEERMTAAEQGWAEVDSALNDVAAEVDELRGQIGAVDADTARRLALVSTRLRGIAADPENPVPEAPTEPDTPVDPAPTDPQPVDPDQPNF